MTDKIIVSSTCASEAEARRLARALVEARLAACAAVQAPQQSCYWWQGQLCEETEWGVSFKTRLDLFPALRAELSRLHAYEVPQIVAVPIVEASAAYLAWMDAELRPVDCGGQ
jgi:periplasmic divalent cation tolerance protein